MITAAQREAWSAVPVDDVGYLPSADLLAMGDDELRSLITRMEQARYAGWRNHDGLWMAAMRLDEAAGLEVLDFGCGTGLEALQYAKAGARVTVADINEENARLAARVLEVFGYQAQDVITLAPDGPLIPFRVIFDVVNMSGVLHHIPEPVHVVAEVASWLQPGELRLMVYSDAGWRDITKTEPPDDVTNHPQRSQFVRHFDAVGDWADWYDEARLRARFGEWFDVRDVRYITPSGHFLTARLVRR